MATINAFIRNGTGKGVARQLRRELRIPAVMYGGGQANLNLVLDRKEFSALISKEGGKLKTHSQLLVVDGGSRYPVLLRGVQYHPVTSQPLHADFLSFDPDRKLSVLVPLHLVDEDQSPGCKRGGMAQLVAHQLEIHCKAGDIPDHLDISMAGLEIGEAVHVKDLKLPAGVECHLEASQTLASVIGVKAQAISDESA